VKVALVTTPPSVRSGIGDYTYRLLPYLREHCDVEIFVEPVHEGEEWEGGRVRSVLDLDPRGWDQVLYQLGNEHSHHFMPRMVRTVGGTVMQHDWVLFDMMLAGHPALVRGGLKGHLLALREGGVGQTRLYARNWLDRRNQRNEPELVDDAPELEGTILAGWHDPEENGRWTADCGYVRIPHSEVREVEIDLLVDAGRRVRIRQGEEVLADGVEGTFRASPADGDRPVLGIETSGIRVTREQRRHGDSRRIGSFVRRIRWRDGDEWNDLDLTGLATRPIRSVTLSRDRFLLPFNRSVVRFADAFIVHSRYLKDRILRDRNAHTPVGILSHGAERLWSDEDRKVRRREFGLSPEWVDSFLITSFGGVQLHKRIDKAMEALARARRTHEDIRMVLAGSLKCDDFEPRGYARSLGLEDAIRFTGFVSAEDGWSWLHAGDIGLNLRGPSSGGTSGGIFQAFSVGRAVIASDAAEQKELPGSCVVKVPLGEGEVDALARALIDLRNDAARREGLETAVRDHVETECHWGVVAKQYAEFLEAFPRPRVTRRRLIAMRVTLERNARSRSTNT